MARQSEDAFKTFREAGRMMGNRTLQEIGDIGEAALDQDAGGDLGAVAALAVHDDGDRPVQGRERIGEDGEGAAKQQRLEELYFRQR